MKRFSHSALMNSLVADYPKKSRTINGNVDYTDSQRMHYCQSGWDLNGIYTLSLHRWSQRGACICVNVIVVVVVVVFISVCRHERCALVENAALNNNFHAVIENTSTSSTFLPFATALFLSHAFVSMNGVRILEIQMIFGNKKDGNKMESLKVDFFPSN